MKNRSLPDLNPLDKELLLDNESQIQIRRVFRANRSIITFQKPITENITFKNQSRYYKVSNKSILFNLKEQTNNLQNLNENFVPDYQILKSESEEEVEFVQSKRNINEAITKNTKLINKYRKRLLQ